jgi:hypothetical protein
MTIYRLVVTIFLAICAEAMGQTSFWPNSTNPGTPEVTNDTASVTLGLRFYSDVPGSVTAVRFYKGAHNTGTHVGNLWSSTGTKLASVTFSGETASGWQQANFSSPVSIAANTSYVISYVAPGGYYAADQYYSWSSLTAGPLHLSGSTPGVYVYGSVAAFPGSSWNGSNYWVDVVFVPSGASNPSSTYNISGKVTGSVAKLTLSGADSRSTTTDGAGNYSFAGLPNGSYAVTASQSGYAFAPSNASVSINGASVAGVNFTASAQTSLSFWSGSTNPGTPEVTNDTASVTLGLKFYSDVPGSVTAVRFYKGLHNTGTHVGNLWSSTGTKLATVTFSAETASGWQQANFSSPISIAANTTYVISYLAPNGRYALNLSYPWSSLNAGALHLSGSAPGVYAYGSAAGFPGSTWNGSNYWVDVVFVPSGASNPPTTYIISGKVSGSAATLTLSGPRSASTTTDGAGNYSFSALPNGSYVVAASQSGYAFTPPTRGVTINGSNVAGVNFTSTAVIPHSVTLSWAPSTSPNITGYNLHRATVSGGPYVRLNTVAGTTYVDHSVAAGQTYFYMATAVDSSSNESTSSNQAMALVPTP